MPRRPLSPARLRRWSVLLGIVGGVWWWVTRTLAGSWWWAAALNLVPPQVLLPWPLLLAYHAWRLKKPGWLGLNLLLASLMTVVLAGFVLPRAEQAPAGVSLTVLSLNTNHAQVRPEKLAEVAVREGVQVIALQEALDRQRQPEPFESALRRAFPGWTVVRNDELLTLTRLPLLERRTLQFPNSPHSLLLTQVRAEGHTVDVVNTHLPTLSVLPTASDRTLGRTLAERVQRSLQLRRDFQQVVGKLARQDTIPLILAGDLNAPPRGGVHFQLRSVGWQDAFTAAGWGFGFTHHALLPHSRIDYVWLHGPHAETARPLPDLLSDHRALLVKVRIREQ